jgi:short subunit dehydrogenase-like uncharacterized protein
LSQIVLLGATGYTGRLVARELMRAGVDFMLTARDAGRLHSLAAELGNPPTEVVDVTRADSLGSALASGSVVINCAGPFSVLGEPVIRACIAHRAHYLDITGEQRFMKHIFDRYDRPAYEAGVAVVNAAAFEYAIGDSLATVAAQRVGGRLLSLDVFYRWPGGATISSRGTRRSVLQVVGEGGWSYQRGKHRERRTGAARCSVRLPDGRGRTAVWFPAGEIVTVPRHIQVEEVNGWIVMGKRSGALVPKLARALPTLVRATRPLAEWVIQHGPQGPRASERETSRFAVEVSAVASTGERVCATAEGRDPYGVTAVIALRLAQRLQERESAVTGVLSPAEVVDAEEFLDGLRSHGVTWATTCSITPLVADDSRPFRSL